ncbi:hypothetical protein BGX27_002369 [Mortierella sp. AM989]|nr:hypothetical protein BGX27_002369 [Mortierella sp. AM989]
MESEYLDIVNKEILEVELFFKELYSSTSTSSSILPATYTPGLLPFLKLHDITFLQCTNCTRTFAAFSSSETNSEAEKHLVEDLRERYKQLKVIQDQLHLELTRLRIWERTSQPTHADPLKPTGTEYASKCSKDTEKISATSPAKVQAAPKDSENDRIPLQNIMFVTLFLCIAVSIIYCIAYVIYYSIASLSASMQPQQTYTFAWPRH